MISLCTRRGDGIHDFAAVYGLRKAVVVHLLGADFDRLVISRSDAEEKARMIKHRLA